ncbi:MAG: MFS transporter [Gaiellaceae bacterium]
MSWLGGHEPGWFHGRNRLASPAGPRALTARLVRDPRGLVLVATILGSSMAFVDGTVVNVALPTIGRHLRLDLAGRQWVFLSYSLALAALYLPAGAVADRFGRRRTFVAGALGFSVASALAGLSPNGDFLIAARALQGLAAAFLSIGSLSLLRFTYGEESGRAVGLWTAWTGIATILGPPLGGALVQWASWRLIFFVNLPLALAAALVAGRAAPGEKGPQERRPLDVAGAALLAVGFGLLTYALVQTGSRGIASAWLAFAAAAAALAGGLVHELRTSSPMLPPVLFGSRNFVSANAETLLVYGGLGGSTFFLVLYLQSVVGYTPFESSLVMLPISGIMILLAGRFGRLADRHGPRLYLTIGPGVMAAGMLVWMLVTSRDDWPQLAAGVVLFGLGLAITVAPITATALAAAPARLSGIAAGVNNTVSRIGGLVAVALIGLVIARVGAPAGGHGNPLSGQATSGGGRGGSIDGFRAGIAVAALLCLAGAGVALIGISNGERTKKEAAEAPLDGHPLGDARH